MAEVFKSCFWMRLYRAPSPKRHICYSNSAWVERFNIGRLKGWKKSMNQDQRNTVEYRDANGKKRFHGSRNLRKTESRAQILSLLIILHAGHAPIPTATQALPIAIWDGRARTDPSPDGGLPSTELS